MSSFLANINNKFFNYIKQFDFYRKLIVISSIYKKLNRKFGKNNESKVFLVKNIKKINIFKVNTSKAHQIRLLFENLNIEISDEGFIYFLDIYNNLIHEWEVTIDNMSIDYSKVINYSLNDYIMLNKSDSEYCNNQKELLMGIKNLIINICDKLEESNRKDNKKFIEYFENILNKKAECFEEALQRILFFNQLLWQTGHTLNGLGRLDVILNDIYYHDENLTKENAFMLIKDFLKTLHKYYWFKSSVLMGDTGQIIVLGGKNSDGTYFYNDLTYLFIKAIKDLHLPDPKILLRVCDDTPRDLINVSLDAISTGIGSPLLSNDDKIIKNMINFGYEPEDAYNYIVSACWEPSAVGNGLEQNNLLFLSFIKPLNNLLDNEDLENITDFEKLIELYKYYLKLEVDELISSLNSMKFTEDPLLSLFVDDCNKKQIDISKGGAKYNHYGFTTVSLGNAVNSLINIKRFVFETNEYEFVEINQIRRNNFENNENLRNQLSTYDLHFGRDDEEVIFLTNSITEYLEGLLIRYYNPLGGKIKFGLSAPTYISAAENMPASFDGRKHFEPFSTHISSDSNKEFTELIRFASKINYDGIKFNGNVVDLMTTPNFILDNFDKFTDFLIGSIKLGFFQMQMNVVDSNTLIKAKKSPELYSNLIVRVWGFSAYFNDLPLSYKDLLIKRALKNEGKLS